MTPPLAVVKVGGSLYDLPELGARLRLWLDEHFLAANVLLVPGGGPTVEALRQLDRLHALGEERSHWLALRALSVNAHFLAALLPSARIVTDVNAEKDGTRALLDVHAFAQADEARPGRLPHRWSVTSDAFAARAAVVMRARHLVLLKSTTIPQGLDWSEAGRLGFVDEMFAEVLREAKTELQVRAMNLREYSLRAGSVS